MSLPTIHPYDRSIIIQTLDQVIALLQRKDCRTARQLVVEHRLRVDLLPIATRDLRLWIPNKPEAPLAAHFNLEKGKSWPSLPRAAFIGALLLIAATSVWGGYSALSAVAEKSVRSAIEQTPRQTTTQHPRTEYFNPQP